VLPAPLQAVFSIQAWDLALLNGAKQPLQSVMLGVVTQKLQEVFGKHFFERVLQVRVLCSHRHRTRRPQTLALAALLPLPISRSCSFAPQTLGMP